MHLDFTSILPIDPFILVLFPAKRIIHYGMLSLKAPFSRPLILLVGWSLSSFPLCTLPLKFFWFEKKIDCRTGLLVVPSGLYLMSTQKSVLVLSFPSHPGTFCTIPFVLKKQKRPSAQSESWSQSPSHNPSGRGGGFSGCVKRLTTCSCSPSSGCWSSSGWSDSSSWVLFPSIAVSLGLALGIGSEITPGQVDGLLEENWSLVRYRWNCSRQKSVTTPAGIERTSIREVGECWRLVIESLWRSRK